MGDMLGSAIRPNHYSSKKVRQNFNPDHLDSVKGMVSRMCLLAAADLHVEIFLLCIYVQ